MKKLLWSYVGLAALAVLAIVSALVSIRRAVHVFDNAVTSAETSIARNATMSRLDELATQIDIPGNAVFANGDIPGESQRMEAAVALFRSALRSVRGGLVAGLAPRQAAAIANNLDEADRWTLRILGDGRQIFVLLQAGRTDLASARMAAMDTSYAQLRRKLSAADDLIHIFRAEQIHRQREEVSGEWWFERAVGVLLLFAIAAIVIYGRRMLRETVVVDDLFRREEELRRANIAFEHAISGISFVDREGRFKFLSRSIASMLGYETEEITGAASAEFVHPEDSDILRKSNDELLETGRSEIEVRIRHKSAAWVDARLVRVSSFDDNGNYLGHYVFAQDITEQKRAETALRKSEERFALATRATNDLIFEWNLKTNQCWVNEAWSTRFGNEVWGDVDISDWADALHPEDRERVIASNQAAIAAKSQLECEYRLKRGDGTYAEVLTRSYVIYSEGGEPLRMVGATMDISERNRRERAYTAQLLDAAADGVISGDVNGRVAFVNQSAARMLGWDAEELIGNDLHAAVHKHSDATACPGYASVLAGQSKQNDKEFFNRKDGSSFPVEYECTPIREFDGHISGGLVTFRDISARRAVEKMKDEFVSVVSHELRTPLTSIRGALGLLAGGRVGEMSPRGKRMLDIAVSNTDRLVRLINDILDIERMDSGKITLNREVCNAQTLMWQAVESMRPMADHAQVELECGVCDELLLADPDRLTQTFVNLLSNAIKFSPPKSQVTLYGSVIDGKVMFEVADQGRGIPQDKLEIIFERFQQVDASDAREKGGSGLGLTICRSIVRQHGGEIWVESVPGVGSRFRFTIPRSEEAVIGDASAGRTVMICDDDASILEVMSTILEQRGYQTVTAGSGAELLRRIEGVAPDVVLLDLLMPGLNGCETLAKLKENANTADIPVVIMSIFSPADSQWPVGDLAGWVQKPIDERTVVNALEHAFGDGARRNSVLLIEDDIDLARVIAAGFERQGIETVHVTGGRAAIEEAKKMTPDLLILDIGLPDIDGYAVVDWLKDHNMLRSVPVVVYSASEPTQSQRDRLTFGPTQFLTKSRITPDEFERRVVQLLDNVTSATKEMSHVA